MNNENPEQNLTQPVLEFSALVADLENQANALTALKAKKGPSSPEAKDRVKYNAWRHGFTGQVLIMTPEEREKFDPFVKGMMSDLAPVGTHETFLANSMAEEAWRLNQIRARCANLAAVGDFYGAGDKYVPMEGQNPAIATAVIDAVVTRDQSKQLALMSLYGQRTQRAYEKYKKELNELQEKRKAHEANELEEARLLFQLADTEGLTYDPKQDSFVFSLQLIKATPTVTTGSFSRKEPKETTGRTTIWPKSPEQRAKRREKLKTTRKKFLSGVHPRVYRRAIMPPLYFSTPTTGKLRPNQRTQPQPLHNTQCFDMLPWYRFQFSATYTVCGL